MKRVAFIWITITVLGFSSIAYSQSAGSVVAPGAKIEKLATGFVWAEGPTVCPEGNVFFSDNRGNKIFKWSPNGTLSTFMEKSRSDNGMMIGKDGILYSCAGDSKELVSIDRDGNYSTLVDSYDGKPLSAPNDLWIDPKGGIYFTDPYWGRETGRDRVFYLASNRTSGKKTLILVNSDMFNPNGVIGTPDGKRLYVSNYIENKTYMFDINGDGTLSNKRLFAPEGDDGMTMDNEGNVYLTGKTITVYNPEGVKIDSIEVPETPSNLTFCGTDKKTLFITARTSVYSIRMRTQGL
ncbi:SMP-30/gluconolactonase/LRE family protein [Candidatus Latescibacterota bacterium]